MSLERCKAVSRIGIILAGGLSRRMGTDKALLALNGINLLERSISILKEANCDEIVLSGYPRNDFVGRVIPDEAAEAGPVSGIISCLKHIVQHHPIGTECLFIAIDMPKATSNLLNQLVTNSQGCDGAYFEGHPLPFCLRISDAIETLVYTSCATFSGPKAPSIRSILAPLKITLLQPDPELLNQLININTPEAWKKIANSM